MLHTITRVSLVCSLSLALTTACIADFEDEIGAEQQAGLGDGGCQPWKCGVNTNIIDAFYTGELNLDGIANAADYRIVSVEKSGVHYVLDMAGDTFVAKTSSGSIVYSGSAMINAIIWLEDGAGDRHQIHVRDFNDTMPYWTHPNDVVSAYHLAYYVEPEGEDGYYEDMCDDPPVGDPNVPVGFETYATLLHGERYDGDRAEVKPAQADDNRWVTIACAGTALSKMKFLRHTPYEPPGAYFTTKDQRQATLKMIISDICGTGHSFTKKGTPILWADRFGWATYSATDVDTFEAVWNERGALCIDTPRLSYDGGSPTLYEDMMREIATVCEVPPTCDPDELPSGHWQTANPK